MRTLFTTVAVAASLAIAGTSAMATNAVHTSKRGHALREHATVHAAAPRHDARGPYNVDVGQLFQFMFGGGSHPMNVRLARSARAMHGHQSASWTYSPSYDSPPINTGSTADDTAAAIQQLNNTNAMLQSMQAAQQQNDEANAAVSAGIAAAIQTEINANN